jgi:hypothetical protein
VKASDLTKEGLARFDKLNAFYVSMSAQPDNFVRPTRTSYRLRMTSA